MLFIVSCQLRVILFANRQFRDKFILLSKLLWLSLYERTNTTVPVLPQIIQISNDLLWVLLLSLLNLIKTWYLVPSVKMNTESDPRLFIWTSLNSQLHHVRAFFYLFEVEVCDACRDTSAHCVEVDLDWYLSYYKFYFFLVEPLQLRVVDRFKSQFNTGL